MKINSFFSYTLPDFLTIILSYVSFMAAATSSLSDYLLTSMTGLKDILMREVRRGGGLCSDIIMFGKVKSHLSQDGTGQYGEGVPGMPTGGSKG